MYPTALYHKLMNTKYFLPFVTTNVNPYLKMDYMDINSHILLGKSINNNAVRFGSSAGLHHYQRGCFSGTGFLVLVFEGLNLVIMMVSLIATTHLELNLNI